MISIRTLSTTVALCVLVFQLATMHVQFSIPSFAYGAFSLVQPTGSDSYTYKPLPVRLVSAEPERDSILFVGDVLLARNIEHLMHREGFDYPYRGVNFRSISVHPYVVGNFEASVPEVHVPTPVRMINFSVHEKFLPDLSRAGFTHVSLANNHALDFGQENFEHTQSKLLEHAIEPVGHPRTFDESSVAFVTVKDTEAALITLHTLERIPSVTEIQSVVRYASRRSDVQILFVHWGNEYQREHSKRQRDVAERFVAAGVDVIIGHHPHVVQDIELISGVPVLYSLGNYIFDQYDSTDTQVGLMVQFLPENGGAISLFPVTSVGALSQPRFMEPSEHITFLHALASRSDEALQEYIVAGKIPLDISVATSLKMAMMSQ